MLHKRILTLSLGTAAAFLALGLTGGDIAYAGTPGTGGLPWEGPLNTVVVSLRGPVALSISFLGMLVAGFTLILGGEINDLVRRIIMLVLVISILAFTAGFLQVIFGLGGAVIASNSSVMSLVGAA